MPQVADDLTPDGGQSGCPYGALPDQAFWSRAVARLAPGDVDPAGGAPFQITPSDRIASAGSCFAQHIARRLAGAGYNYLVTEPGYPRLGERLAAKYNYGTFTARYGNIYTARQLVQLFDRAYGAFIPAEPFWRNGDHWIDPFRPMVQPKGFASKTEARVDRDQHLAAVREMMETLDVFIFTFGLTESWICTDDQAVLPVCPGCGVGAFDPARYAFKNFDVAEVIADFTAFATRLRGVNPRARIVLTVSPVPLVATYSGDHVLSATTYSKAVLRVAAGQLARSLDACAYFPSFEIITGAFSRGGYYAPDLREVEPAGVDHVMRVFFRQFGLTPQAAAAPTGPTSIARRTRNLLDAYCEEYQSLAGIADDR